MTDTLDLAVRAAQVAFDEAQDASPAVRAGWLRAIAHSVEGAREALVQLAMAETHLGEARLNGEVLRTTFQLRILADELQTGSFLDATIDHADDNWGMGPRPDIRRMNVPLGVVAVFGASNFPFAFSVIGGDTASALAAGCSVVHKGHSDHAQLAAMTADVVREALHHAGAPRDLLTLVLGRGIGRELVLNPAVQAVGFTGSTSGGRQLFDMASSREKPIPFFGELGSTNPVFVTDGAWAERHDDILEGFVSSAFLGMGQFCTKPGLLMVPFLTDEQRQKISSLVGDVPRFDMLSKRLRESFEDERDSVAALPDVEILTQAIGGTAPAATVLEVPVDALEAHPHLISHEMFGPAAIIVTGVTGRHLSTVSESIGGQLTATIFSELHEDTEPLVKALGAQVGRLLFNQWSTGVSVTYAQQHGGPYPSSTTSSATSVGTFSVRRWMRPLAFQNAPRHSMPEELWDENPRAILQRIDGTLTTKSGVNAI